MTLIGDRIGQASYSELSTLADCEQKWVYRYGGEKVDTPPSVAMAKGTLIHGGTNTFWDTADWRPGFEAALDELGEKWDPAVYQDAIPDAEWILARYAEVYYDLARSAKVEHIEAELYATLPGAAIPGTGLKIKGFVDRTVIINGQRWLVETKTMRDWSRLDLVTVDPQLTLYYWLAQQNDLEPYGILFDAIRTYRWKAEKPSQAQVINEQLRWAEENPGVNIPTWLTPTWVEHLPDLTPAKRKQEWARRAVELHPGTERPAHESFQQMWLDRSPEQVDAALAWAQSIQNRRGMLNLAAPPIRNVNTYCKTCPYRDQCFDEMAFPPTEIEMEL